jgi:antitoxin HicB
MRKKNTRPKKGRIGSSFDDYLKDEGAYVETSAVAIKRVLAWQLEKAMQKEGVSKNEMAKRMHTSRSQLDRILDPDNDKIQLDTVFKAAHVLGSEDGAGLGAMPFPTAAERRLDRLYHWQRFDPLVLAVALVAVTAPVISLVVARANDRDRREQH